MMPLSTLQNLTSNQNKVSDVLVKVTDNANVTTVSNEIEMLIQTNLLQLLLQIQLTE
jgi:hypothetical protein